MSCPSDSASFSGLRDEAMIDDSTSFEGCCPRHDGLIDGLIDGSRDRGSKNKLMRRSRLVQFAVARRIKRKTLVV